MCTVTFAPNKKGYALAMNRDELLTRVTAKPPARKMIKGCLVIAPSEPGGGTWISVNGRGICLTLINWYAIAAHVRDHSLSRGEVIKAARTADSRKFVDDVLDKLPLQRINPFRLIGFFPGTKKITEWQWNLRQLVSKNHQWDLRQWVSSGFDEATAQRVRATTFREAQQQSDASSLAWLRRLHRSHLPAVGPFSICMHRTDAATLSYTEVVVALSQATMSYQSGAPCEGGKISSSDQT
jgi:hypothetical protein